MDNKRSILDSILSKFNKPTQGKKAPSKFQGLLDKVGGVTRYDSKDHVNSAPQMMKRKQESLGKPSAAKAAGYRPM